MYDRLYGPETGMSLGNKKATNPINQANQNPALGSLKHFGSMINKNILQPTATALNYANPVTLTRNLWDTAGQLPQTLREFDASRLKGNASKKPTVCPDDESAKLFH